MSVNKISSLVCQTAWNGKSFTIDVFETCSADKVHSLKKLNKAVSNKAGALPLNSFRICQAGKEILHFSQINTDFILKVELSLKGGKGGYGSLLRSMKPKAKAD